MITSEMLARINALAKKSREGGLTDVEREEQADLRRRYIEHIKVQVKAQLDSIEFVDEDDHANCDHPGHKH